MRNKRNDIHAISNDLSQLSSCASKHEMKLLKKRGQTVTQARRGNSSPVEQGIADPWVVGSIPACPSFSFFSVPGSVLSRGSLLPNQRWSIQPQQSITIGRVLLVECACRNTNSVPSAQITRTVAGSRQEG